MGEARKIGIAFKRGNIRQTRASDSLTLICLEFLHTYRCIGRDIKDEPGQLHIARFPVLRVALELNSCVLGIFLENKWASADRFPTDIRGMALLQQFAAYSEDKIDATAGAASLDRKGA